MIKIVVASLLWHRRTPETHSTTCGLGLLTRGFEISLSMTSPVEALTVARGIAAEMAPETVECEPCPGCFKA